MTIPSDSSVFWSFFPGWVGIWLVAALGMSLLDKTRLRHYVILAVALSFASGYAATIFPWLWRFLLNADETTVPFHLVELTQQIAVALLCGAAVGLAAVVSLLLRVMPALIASRVRPTRIYRYVRMLASLHHDGPAVE